MEKNKLAIGLINLRSQIDSRIDNFISENVLRDKEINEQDLENLKESIAYIVKDRIGFMK